MFTSTSYTVEAVEAVEVEVRIGGAVPPEVVKNCLAQLSFPPTQVVGVDVAHDNRPGFVLSNVNKNQLKEVLASIEGGCAHAELCHITPSPSSGLYAVASDYGTGEEGGLFDPNLTYE